MAAVRFKINDTNPSAKQYSRHRSVHQKSLTLTYTIPDIALR